MWPRTDLAELLRIEHPIIQAPMAGSTNPALAGAVSNAGGLGSLGCARLGPDELRERAGELRAATNRPFNLNFFTHPVPVADPAAIAHMQALLAPYYDELGAGAVPDPHPLFLGFDDAILEAVLAIRPPVVSFHYGLPDAEAVRAVKATGAVVLCSATTVAEARQLEADGADAVIAQGYEAGGHRGTFSGSLDGGTVATLPLVPQVAAAVRVPVIAAGGIGDGRGIAAAFALGASGVQMGTAFLSCPEASVAPLYRQALLDADDESTRMTRIISGRPARGIRNRLMDDLADAEAQALAFPLQYSLTSPLAAASAKHGSPRFLAMWAGQAVGLNRPLPAAELVERLVEETRETFALLGRGAG